jgi:hypothetical protein
MYPGSIFGPLFSEQTETNVREHALDSGSFVVSATALLDSDQQAQIMKDTGAPIGPISGGLFTAIANPDGWLIGGPLKAGEGKVIADRFRPDRFAQAAHGLARPLQPCRTAQSAYRLHAPDTSVSASPTPTPSFCTRLRMK